MSEMVERVAHWLYFEMVDRHGYPNGFPTWDEMSQMDESSNVNCQRRFRDDARAAIEAMREPTEAMVAAGMLAGSGPEFADPDETWRAMIAAALPQEGGER